MIRLHGLIAFSAFLFSYACVPQSQTPSITMAQFSKLETGMTYDQAVAILGKPGVEMSRSDVAGTVTVLYTWDAGGLANMNAMFQNGKMISKAQLGLK